MWPRDAVGGFAVFAFARAIARGVGWLHDFASISTWAARPTGIDFGPWQQPVFGDALAELTALLARQELPRERRNEGGRTRSRQASTPALPSRQPGDAMAHPASQSRARPRTAADAVGPARIPTTRLAALAGRPPPATRGGSPARLSKDGARTSPPSPANDGAGLPTRAANRLSRPAFVTRTHASERLGRILTRRVRHSVSAITSPPDTAAAIEAAWRHGIAAPESGLRLEQAAALSVGQTTLRRDGALAAGSGLPRARAAGTHVEAGTARRRFLPESLTELGHGQKRSVAGPLDLSNAAARTADEATPSSANTEAGESPSFAVLAAPRRVSAPMPSSAPGITAATHPAGSRIRLDPFEFAEQLRDVLLADARRHGIDV